MPIIVKLDMQLLAKKMSLRELSDHTGLNTWNLSLLKNNEIGGIRLSTLEEICKALDCQPGDLFEYIKP